MLMDELMRLKQDLLQVTTELVANCRFCTKISSNPEDVAPISCTKYSGSSTPISINVATCLGCGEYKSLKSNIQNAVV